MNNPRRPLRHVPRPVESMSEAPQPRLSPSSKPPEISTAPVPHRKPFIRRSPTQGGAARTERHPTSHRVSGKKKTPLVVGASIGALILLILVIVAVAGGGGGRASLTGETSQRPKASPVNVEGLEREGLRKCEEGLSCVQQSYHAADKAGLQRGIALISDGTSMLSKANEVSGNKYDVKKYTEALLMARRKVAELK